MPPFLRPAARTGGPDLPPAAGDGSLALDQWRGLALVMVLIAHAFHETGRVDGLGRVGVNLFFFISGILVFRSLDGRAHASAWQRTRWFWWRRLWRLYPALLAYLLVMAVAEYWLQRLPGQPEPSDYRTFLAGLPAALFYYVNYHLSVASLGHLWSLACEMQFYLLAPLLFTLGEASKGNRTLVFGYTLLGFMGVGLMQPLTSQFWFMSKYEFQAAVWPMVLGFFCEYQRPLLLKAPAHWRGGAYWLTLAVSLPGLALMFDGSEMKLPTIAVGCLLLAPCLLAYADGRTFAPRRLGGSLAWLGRRTYSIYIWQQAFTICWFLPVRWWPAGAVAAVGLGAVWFRWFEAPFLSAGRSRRPAAPARG